MREKGFQPGFRLGKDVLQCRGAFWRETELPSEAQFCKTGGSVALLLPFTFLSSESISTKNLTVIPCRSSFSKLACKSLTVSLTNGCYHRYLDDDVPT